jgi:hypothetical protein
MTPEILELQNELDDERVKLAVAHSTHQLAEIACDRARAAVSRQDHHVTSLKIQLQALLESLETDDEDEQDELEVEDDDAVL